MLADVVQNLSSPPFVEELFKKQKMYTEEGVRKLFERLAHSSIMRLNESSMSKVIDVDSQIFSYVI